MLFPIQFIIKYTPWYLMTFLFVRGLSLVLVAKLFTAVDLLRENNMKFVLL